MLMRCLLILLVSCIVYVVAVLTAAALPVAAQSLTPLPITGSTCKTTGSGTICRAVLDTTFSFPAEFTCGNGAGSFAVDEQGATHREYTFFYDRNGNETKETLHISPLEGTFTNATSGKSAVESAHFVITHILSTPGDPSTDQETVDGLFAKVVLPHKGNVLLDVGRVIYDPDGDVSFSAGPHQFNDGQISELCTALA